MAHILEAQCERCGETFNPIDKWDFMHGVNDQGIYCGGFGKLLGEYSKPLDSGMDER